MTIGELAARVGLNDSAIRYYERRGLLAPDGRTASNYRYYGPRALEQLRFIRSAQASGLALGDIQALLDFQDGRAGACDEVMSVIDARLAEVTERMKHLRHVQRELKRYRAACERTPAGETCPVLDELGEPGG